MVILTGVLALHLVEELKTAFRKKYRLDHAAGLLFASFNVLVYVCWLIASLFFVSGSGLAVLLAWILAAVAMVNGLAHLTILCVTKRYFPGGFTAFPVVLASLYVLVSLPR